MDRTVGRALNSGTQGVYKSIDELAPVYGANALVPYEASILYNIFVKTVAHDASKLVIPVLGVMAAEALWEQFDAKQMTRAELEAGLSSLDDAYKGPRAVSRVGRVFMITGIVFTAIEVTRATSQSIEQRSDKPIAAETLRQVGGWGSAFAGAKIGALTGAAFEIETGPGAIITGAIGAVIFGAAGYFSADWIADHIAENQEDIFVMRKPDQTEPLPPWIEYPGTDPIWGGVATRSE